jgi:hypothetical protein
MGCRVAGKSLVPPKFIENQPFMADFLFKKNFDSKRW